MNVLTLCYKTQNGSIKVVVPEDSVEHCSALLSAAGVVSSFVSVDFPSVEFVHSAAVVDHLSAGVDHLSAGLGSLSVVAR